MRFRHFMLPGLGAVLLPALPITAAPVSTAGSHVLESSNLIESQHHHHRKRRARCRFDHGRLVCGPRRHHGDRRRGKRHRGGRH